MRRSRQCMWWAQGAAGETGSEAAAPAHTLALSNPSSTAASSHPGCPTGLPPADQRRARAGRRPRRRALQSTARPSSAGWPAAGWPGSGQSAPGRRPAPPPGLQVFGKRTGRGEATLGESHPRAGHPPRLPTHMATEPPNRPQRHPRTLLLEREEEGEAVDGELKGGGLARGARQRSRVLLRPGEGGREVVSLDLFRGRETAERGSGRKRGQGRGPGCEAGL